MHHERAWIFRWLAFIGIDLEKDHVGEDLTDDHTVEKGGDDLPDPLFFLDFLTLNRIDMFHHNK